MKIDQIWEEMEEESRGSKAAWLTRLATPNKGYPLFVAFECQTRTRAFLLPVTNSHVPLRQKVPECKGLALSVVVLNSIPHVVVRLREKSFRDVFATLTDDIAAHIVPSPDPGEAITRFLARLERWQQFLAAFGKEWSPERQRGLWGELHVLRSHLIPVIGGVCSIQAWKAAAAAHQDFQFPHGAVEVKTTAAKQPQNIRITSERQLDEQGVGVLLLHVVIVDEREVAPDRDAPGESLPAMIASLRALLADNPAALFLFNDLLLGAGWLDAESDKYDNRRWTIRRERTYKVADAFPRLVEQDLMPGVGDVSYNIALAACEPFVVPINVIGLVATGKA